MGNAFYNIFGIVLGLMLLYFGIVKLIKEKTKLFSILTIIHSGLFIFFGIFGFFLPKEYEFLTILALLAFSITMAIIMLTLYKGKKTNKK